jgi:hypothetical protein
MKGNWSAHTSRGHVTPLSILGQHLPITITLLAPDDTRREPKLLASLSSALLIRYSSLSIMHDDDMSLGLRPGSTQGAPGTPEVSNRHNGHTLMHWKRTYKSSLSCIYICICIIHMAELMHTRCTCICGEVAGTKSLV